MCDLTLRVNSGSPVVDSAGFRFTSFQTGLGVNPDHTPMPQERHPLENFPNPFNPSTQIRFVLSSPGRAILQVFNLLGQEVSVLVDESLPVGERSVARDARSYASGIYLCRLQTGSLCEVRKLILEK
jgi:hypothetical protein